MHSNGKVLANVKCNVLWRLIKVIAQVIVRRTLIVSVCVCKLCSVQLNKNQNKTHTKKKRNRKKGRKKMLTSVEVPVARRNSFQPLSSYHSIPAEEIYRFKNNDSKLTKNRARLFKTNDVVS